MRGKINLEVLKDHAMELYDKDPATTKCSLLRTLQGPVMDTSSSLPPINSRTIILVCFEAALLIKVESDNEQGQEEQTVTKSTGNQPSKRPLQCSHANSQLAVSMSAFKSKKKRGKSLVRLMIS